MRLEEHTMIMGAWVMAQSSKCLPGKHEVLESGHPTSREKLGLAVNICKPMAGGNEDRRISKFQANDRPHLKNKVQPDRMTSVL